MLEYHNIFMALKTFDKLDIKAINYYDWLGKSCASGFVKTNLRS